MTRSMDPESGEYPRPPKKESWRTVLVLAYQSLGVVYGDLSISPLYVYKSTFAEDIRHSGSNDEALGVLSIVFWTLTLVTLFKYVFIVLRADDNGQGGTFALYSLICRHANVSLLPNRQAADEELSTYKLENHERKDDSRMKIWIEKHKNLHIALLVVVMLGTCMVIGGGVLTPAISVFSAVSGLELHMANGTYECSEAMFADLGHFSYTAIQIAFTSLVYPALILAYMGQAAYLSKHHKISNIYQIGFYVSVPEKVRIPVIVIAILASVVGSQAIISGTFSIINQSHSLGCFPRVKVVHTSDKIHGQIYIPEINWMLMILCMAVAYGFRDTKHLGNASGLAVISVMLVTTCLTSLVMILCWNKSPFVALAFLLFFGSIEILFFSASLVKFREGAWFPILLALFLMIIMLVWHYAATKKYEFDLHNKVPLDWLLTLGDTLGIAHVPGIGLVYTDLISGVPANFSQFVTNLPAFHRVLVFVCIKYIPVPFVPSAERYLVGRVGPPDHRSYRCIVRYGYRDVHQDNDSFEDELVNSIAYFIELEAYDIASRSSESADGNESGLTIVRSFRPPTSCEVDEITQAALGSSSKENTLELEPRDRMMRARFFIKDKDSSEVAQPAREELEELWEARESGTAFMLGHCHVQAKSGSSIVKKAAINIGYNFLRKNCRSPYVVLRIPASSLLTVGMVYVL